MASYYGNGNGDWVVVCRVVSNTAWQKVLQLVSSNSNNWCKTGPSMQYNGGCKLHPNQAKGETRGGGEFGRQYLPLVSCYSFIV